MKFTWKNFPENPLSHAPKLQNLKKVWKNFPGYPLSHAPLFGKVFRDLPIWVKSRSMSLIVNYFKIKLYIHHWILFLLKNARFFIRFWRYIRLRKPVNIFDQYIEVFIQYLLYISLTVWNLVMLNLNIELKMNIKFQNKRRPVECNFIKGRVLLRIFHIF